MGRVVFLAFPTAASLFGRNFFNISTVESCGFHMLPLLGRLRVSRRLKPVKTEGVRFDVEGVRFDVEGVRFNAQEKAGVFLYTKA